MDSMKEALKRKMMSMKQHPKIEIEIEGADGVKEGSDLAPEREGAEMEGDPMGQMMGPDGQPMHPDHMKILQALGDGGSMGHQAGSLHARAADKVKEKMASIQKHKKGI